MYKRIHIILKMLIYIPVCLFMATLLWYTRSIIKWVYRQKTQLCQLIELKNNLAKISTTSEQSSFTVNDSDTGAVITYNNTGMHYKLHVPYSRRFVAKMLPFKVQLIADGRETKDITQQPGIPYYVTARHLGGDMIQIINMDTGDTHVYGIDDMPEYGEQVME